MARLWCHSVNLHTWNRLQPFILHTSPRTSTHSWRIASDLSNDGSCWGSAAAGLCPAIPHRPTVAHPDTSCANQPASCLSYITSITHMLHCHWKAIKGWAAALPLFYEHPALLPGWSVAAHRLRAGTVRHLSAPLALIITHPSPLLAAAYQLCYFFIVQWFNEVPLA